MVPHGSLSKYVEDSSNDILSNVGMDQGKQKDMLSFFDVSTDVGEMNIDKYVQR